MSSDTTYPLAVLRGELQLLVEGFRDSLENLFGLDGRKRLKCAISHRITEGLELHFADEPGEDGVTAAGIVVAVHDVGSSSRHVVNEDARRCCAVRCDAAEEMMRGVVLPRRCCALRCGAAAKLRCK